jgi:hypothetical protein
LTELLEGFEETALGFGFVAAGEGRVFGGVEQRAGSGLGAILGDQGKVEGLGKLLQLGDLGVDPLDQAVARPDLAIFLVEVAAVAMAEELEVAPEGSREGADPGRGGVIVADSGQPRFPRPGK